MPRLKLFRTTNGIDDYVAVVTRRPAALRERNMKRPSEIGLLVNEIAVVLS